MTTLGGRCYYHQVHFVDEEAEAKSVKGNDQVTQ